MKNPATKVKRSLATELFLGFLGCVALFYILIIVYHYSTPMQRAEATEPDWLEQCRLFCAEYGLVSTGDIKKDAEAYLEVTNRETLSVSLNEILSDSQFEKAETQQHPFLHRQGADFTLPDVEGQAVSLESFRLKKPVILVFYYGYYCSHCVAQLFALEKDLAYFHEMGAKVIAISADSSESTQEKFAKYGSFSFPVLSDHDYRISEAWGLYTRPSQEQAEDLLHGTFVINQAGEVVFANRGHQPFVDNKSLLHWLAELKRESATKVADTSGDAALQRRRD